MQQQHSLKAFLDEWVERINVPAYLDSDPVQFVHRYNRLSDREVVAFLVATITWGNRRSILQSGEKMLAFMGQSPADYILSEGYRNLPTQNIHHTFFTRDFVYVCKGLNRLLNQHQSLEPVFAAPENLWEGFRAFRSELALANDNVFSKHVSNPEAQSACKRLHLALRWLVRNDGIVDLGIWKTLSPEQLFIPLDVHVGRISRELGLLGRTQNDRKAVEQLTETLRTFNPADPVMYDYALFGIGESGLKLNSNCLKMV